MLGIAFATLPDQPTYRAGVILVGLARCIAMVMIWNELARGDTNYCAILVIVNSVLQIILYSPMSLLFINVISHEDSLKLQYGKTATAVLIYLGIPLVAGIITRFSVMALLGRPKFEKVFLAWFGPLALLGLLYTYVLRVEEDTMLTEKDYPDLCTAGDEDSGQHRRRVPRLRPDDPLLRCHVDRDIWPHVLPQPPVWACAGL